MHAWLDTIQAGSVSTWVRESGSLWAYPTVLFLHTVGMAIVVGLNVAVDLRVLGAARRIPLAPLRKFFPLMWAGFGISAVSGLALFAASATTTAANRTFWVKMTCIALALGVMRAMRPRLGAPSGRLLAVASLILWAGAIAAGRLLLYLGPDLGASALMQRIGP
jgi:hypothetical protein